jgi:hypothetical protein
MKRLGIMKCDMVKREYYVEDPSNALVNPPPDLSRPIPGRDGKFQIKKEWITKNKKKHNKEAIEIEQRDYVKDKYFLCYYCKKYGHIAKCCPHKFLYRFEETFKDEKCRSLLRYMQKIRRVPHHIVKDFLKYMENSKQLSMFKHFCRKLHAPREIYEFIEQRWKEVDFIEWNESSLEKKIEFEMTEKNVIKENAKKIKLDLEKAYLDKVDKKAPTSYCKKELQFVNKFMQHKKNEEDLRTIKKYWNKLKPELIERKMSTESIKSKTTAASDIELEMKKMIRNNDKALFDDYIIFATNTVLSDIDGKCKYCAFNWKGTCREWERFNKEKEWHKNQNGKQYYTWKAIDNLQPLQLPKYMDYIQCKNANESQEYIINERNRKQYDEQW